MLKFNLKSNALFLTLLVLFSQVAQAQVSITNSSSSVTLSNGIVSFDVSKTSGAATNLKKLPNGQNMLDPQGIYYDFIVSNKDTSLYLGMSSPGTKTFSVITNTSTMAEIEIRNSSIGYDAVKRPFGLFDIAYRIVLRAGDAGLYIYCIWRHTANQPYASIDFPRNVVRANTSAGWFSATSGNSNIWSVEPDRVMQAIDPNCLSADSLIQNATYVLTNTCTYTDTVGHTENGSPVWTKFDTGYKMGDSTNNNPVWGVMNDQYGVWMMTGSQEFMSGGPEKNKGGTEIALMIMDYAETHGIPDGTMDGKLDSEVVWQKMWGPIFVYANQGAGHDVILNDALAKGNQERNSWPYSWINQDETLYPRTRSTVKGTIKVRDVVGANAMVVLGDSTSDYMAQGAKNYLFWGRADSLGRFSLPKVRPGVYSLFTYVPGFTGSYKVNNITIPAGTTDLGTLVWDRLTRTQKIWNIGTPDHSAKDFRFGGRTRQFGLWWQYLNEVGPGGLTYTIGMSNPKDNWYYAQPDLPLAGGVMDRPNWKVNFNLTTLPPAPCEITVALAGAGMSAFTLLINGTAVTPASTGEYTTDDGEIRRDGTLSGWQQEYKYQFSPSLLKIGINTISVGVRTGGQSSWDTTAAKPVVPSGNLFWDALVLEAGPLLPLLNAGTGAMTYYWTGAAGTSTAPTSWAVATNWNTASNGTGLPRVTPAATDILVFDGTTLGTAERFVGSVPMDTISSLQIINGAKISFISSAYPTTAINDAFTTASYGGCTYNVTGSAGSFKNLRPGDVISTSSAIISPMPYAEVSAILDSTHMTVAKETGFPTAAQSQYFIVPTIYTDVLTVDANSSLQFAASAASGSFFSLIVNTKGGTIAGKVNFNSRGGLCKLLCRTANAGSGTLGLHFTNGSSVTINTSTSGKNNYNLGNTLGLYNNGNFIFDDGTGNNNLTPGYSGDAGIVFDPGSTFTMAIGDNYTPLGASYAASGSLVYTPATAFKKGSKYINNTARITEPYMVVNNANASYPNLEFQAGFPTNLTLAKVDTLTVSGTTVAAVNTGTFVLTGNLSNTTANAINFGNVMMGGSSVQTVSGSGAVSFATLYIADLAELSLARNITAINVHLLGKLNFGNNTITGTGTFATYSRYSKAATTPFTVGSATVGGINNIGAGTLVYQYPVGSSVSDSYLPAKTLYRSFTSGTNGQLSSFAIGTANSQAAVFSIAGSVYTTGSDLPTSTPGFSYLLNVNSSVLPLTLISFAGQPSSGTVNLTWKTTNETGVKQFILEKHSEAETTFVEIAEVSAKNQPSNSYLFTDTKNKNIQKAYYRLRMVDRDGSYTYSNIVLVNMGTSDIDKGITLYPNPVLKYLVITHPSIMSSGIITILTSEGKAVTSITESINSTQTDVDVSKLTPGVYFLRYNGNGKITTLKFIKNQ